MTVKLVQRIKIKGKEIVLVGTVHISQESVDLVKSTIKKEKPNVVAVELDKHRLQQLKSKKK